jgi:hypothetical protein
MSHPEKVRKLIEQLDFNMSTALRVGQELTVMRDSVFMLATRRVASANDSEWRKLRASQNQKQDSNNRV